MNFGGFIALMISIALWVLILGSVGWVIYDEFKEEKKDKKKKS